MSPPRAGCMDRLSIKCKKCGRILLVPLKYKTRRCATCNTINSIDRSKILANGDWKEILESVQESAKSTRGYQTESIRIVKKRIRKPRKMPVA
ncbi:MAG: hypothetical protein ACTSUE_22715 [Promethearchaeota archaeon]